MADPLSVRRSYLRAEGDELEIVIVAEGLPESTAVCPAPMLKEAERHERHEAARRALVLDGYHLVRERLIHNAAFDKKGEKTTLELVYRPCRDEEEAQAVLEKAALYLRQAARDLGLPVPVERSEPRRPSSLSDADSEP